MKITHVTDALSTSGGGLSMAVIELVGALQRHGVEVDVHGIASEGERLMPAASLPLTSHPVTSSRPWPRSKPLRAAVGGSAASALHTHGLWTDGSVAVHEAWRRNGVPYLVSPHGMLDAWALRNSAWKKRIAAWWFEDAHLRHASVIHALCESERQSIRDYGLTNPVAVIPNGVHLPELSEPPKTGGSTKALLFLGRLHPKKGLAELLHAWAHIFAVAGPAGWHLTIAGWDQGGYRAGLLRRCREGGVPVIEMTVEDYLRDQRQSTAAIDPGSVVFVGSAFGDGKDQLLRRSDGFILPSYSEGLPMAVLEAWAYCLPVAMTDPCNLPEGFASGAATKLPTPDWADDFRKALSDFLSQPDDQLVSMGRAGRNLVTQRFTWDRIAAQFAEVYRWLNGASQRPEWVG